MVLTWYLKMLLISWKTFTWKMETEMDGIKTDLRETVWQDCRSM